MPALQLRRPRQFLPQVERLRIFRFYKLKLAFAPPPLNSLFAKDGFVDLLMRLEIHERLHAVPLRKTLNQALAMFLNTTKKIVGDANVKRAVALAGENVDIIAMISHKNP